jgi:hypothetical protein
MVDNGVVTAAAEDAPRLSAVIRPAARRFAEVVCPPEVRADHRTDRVLREFGLMLGALPSAARKALASALILLDQGARVYPPSRGRRFARLDDRTAEAYVRALLARHDAAAELVQRLKGVVTMCYYDLPEVQREIGYDPVPYIAAVSRRRLETYGPQIRAGEAAVTEGPPEPRRPEPRRPEPRRPGPRRSEPRRHEPGLPEPGQR